MNPIISLQNVKFGYTHDDTLEQLAVDLSLDIYPGEFVALVGRNGSGKSTVAKLMNGLLLPGAGQVIVDGLSTSDPEALWDIRRTVGVVFQNPDNQMIATIVEDDLAFGPENLGLPPAQIRERVDWALDAVGLAGFGRRTTSRLSGGQKQRLAIAAILAIKPRVLVLDESTSMLDPEGRAEVLAVATHLNRTEGMTVVLITHFMEEAASADRIVVLERGHLVTSGTRQIFGNAQQLRSLGLDLPLVTQLADQLHTAGLPVDPALTDAQQLLQAVQPLLGELEQPRPQPVDTAQPDPIIQVANLSYIYSRQTPYQKTAIDDITLDIGQGEFFGIVGRTGSGKSTLVTHLNGLIRIQGSGTITVDGISLNGKYDYKRLRSTVGMVFQYPEYQLFDETVAGDVAFGPRNLGLDADQIDARVREALAMVGLEYDSIASRSPFELSGGQKRRVALAGVLAMRPKILVLDEPTAGLDPRGKREILELVQSIRATTPTIIMISHNMEEIAAHCDRIALFDNGRLVRVATPLALFGDEQLVRDSGLQVPTALSLSMQLGLAPHLDIGTLGRAIIARAGEVRADA